MTNRAVELDAGYGDAMAYANLLLRAKAAIVDDPAEVAALIAQADGWVQKALDARKQQPAAPRPPAAPAGHLDVNATPPSLPAVAPPPPPPPPNSFGNQPASASPARHRLPGQSPEAGDFWQVIGDGSVAAKDLADELRAKGFPARLVKLMGTPEAVYVMVGPYSNQQALDKAKAELEAAGVHPLRVR
jgi:cell division protein FtsN